MTSAKKIGIIGAGNMGSALANGIVKAGVAKAGEITVSDTDDAKLAKLAQSGIRTTKANGDVARASDAIIIAVKPNDVEPMLSAISSELAGKLVISIAAGLPISRISAAAPHSRVIRVMPNANAMINKSATGYSLGKNATEEDGALVKGIFSAVGIAFCVDESLLDVVTGLSGSGPAFIYQAIAGMAGEGVRRGLPPDIALLLASKTTEGAGAMVIATGKTPEELTAMVASPGGTTIEGLKVLEEEDVKGIFSDAVGAATDKSKLLGKPREKPK